MLSPPFTAFPVREHLHIVLREVTAADLPALMPISYYDGMQAASVEDAAAMQEKINADYAAGNSVHWVICNAFSNDVVGTCGYYRGFANNTGEIGFILLPAYRGQGYMKTALEEVIYFGRNLMGLDKICAHTTADNDRAIKLLRSLGMEEVTGNRVGYVTFECS